MASAFKSAPAGLLALTTLCILGGCGSSDDNTSTNTAAATNSGTASEGCAFGTQALEDGTCLGEWACPEGWERSELGVGCVPSPLSTSCAEGTFALPSGGCSQPWTCPDGWERVDDGIGCAAPALREDCPEGAFPVPGVEGCSQAWTCPDGWTRMTHGPGCAPSIAAGCNAPDAVPTPDGQCLSLQHTACGSGTFGDHDWPEATVFVDRGAPAGGDGSRQAPVRRFEDGVALAAARTPAVVAVAAGYYRLSASVDLSDIDRIGGTCADEVTLDGDLVASGDHALHDLALASDDTTALVVTSGTTTLSRVALASGGDSMVVRVSDGVVTASDVSIDGRGVAMGVRTSGPGEFSCTRCRIKRTQRAAVWAARGGTIALDHAFITGNTALDPSGITAALRASESSTLTLTNALLRDNALGSLLAEETSATHLTQVAIGHSATPSGDPNHGAELLARDHASVHMEDVHIADGNQRGLCLFDNAEMEGTRVVITDTQKQLLTGDFGHAIVAYDDTRLTLRHAALLDSFGAAMIGAEQSTIDAAHVWVNGVEPNGRAWSYGVRAEEEATLTLTDSTVTGVPGMGIIETMPGGSTTLERVAILDLTDNPSPERESISLISADGGTMDARDILIRGTSYRAVLVNDGSTLDAARLAVTDVAPGPLWTPEDAYPAAIFIQEGGAATLEDVWLRHAHPHATLLSGDTTVRRLTVRDSLSIDDDPDPPNAPAVAVDSTVGATADLAHVDIRSVIGRGIDVYSRATLQDVHIADIARAPSGDGLGVFVTEGAEATLTRARISNLLGAAIIVEGQGTAFVGDDLHISDLPELPVVNKLTMGYAIITLTDADARFEDVRLERCAIIGVTNNDNATLSMERFHMVDAGLIGVLTSLGARTEAKDIALIGGRDFGVIAYDGGELDVEGALITGREAIPNDIGSVAAALANYDSALAARDVVLTANTTDGVQAMVGDVTLERVLIHANQRGLVRLLSGAITQTDTVALDNATDDLVCDTICVEGPNSIEPVERPATPEF